MCSIHFGTTRSTIESELNSLQNEINPKEHNIPHECLGQIFSKIEALRRRTDLRATERSRFVFIEHAYQKLQRTCTLPIRFMCIRIAQLGEACTTKIFSYLPLLEIARLPRVARSGINSKEAALREYLSKDSLNSSDLWQCALVMYPEVYIRPEKFRSPLGNLGLFHPSIIRPFSCFSNVSEGLILKEMLKGIKLSSLNLDHGFDAFTGALEIALEGHSELRSLKCAKSFVKLEELAKNCQNLVQFSGLVCRESNLSTLSHFSELEQINIENTRDESVIINSLMNNEKIKIIDFSYSNREGKINDVNLKSILDFASNRPNCVIRINSANTSFMKNGIYNELLDRLPNIQFQDRVYPQIPLSSRCESVHPPICEPIPS